MELLICGYCGGHVIIQGHGEITYSECTICKAINPPKIDDTDVDDESDDDLYI